METMEMTTAAAAAGKPGYKLTKLGWIPEEWEVRKLDDVAEIHNHLRFPLSETVRKGMQGPYPYYGPTKAQDYLDHFRVEGKYVLIGEDGDHFLKFQTQPMTLLVDGQYNVNNHAHLIKGTESCETEWVYWFFNSRDLTNDITRQGAGRYKLTKDALKRLVLVVPPVSEQRAIIDILNALKRQEKAIRALVKAKSIYKSGLMQQLLTGQRRFPEFQGQPATVSKLAPYLREVSVRNRQLAVTRVLSVTNDRGFVNQSDQFDREVASADRSNYKIVRRGQFGYNPSRINVGSIALLDKFEEGALSPLYIIFETDASRLDTQYIKHFFKTDSFNQQLKQQLQGSVRDILSFNGMCQLQLFIPSLPEQQRIAAVLDACDQEIELLQVQLRQWQLQKKGLMQQLLTGQLRVPHI